MEIWIFPKLTGLLAPSFNLMNFFKYSIVSRRSNHIIVHLAFIHNLLVIFAIVLTLIIVLLSLLNIAKLLVTVSLIILRLIVFFVITIWLILILPFLSIILAVVLSS